MVIMRLAEIFPNLEKLMLDSDFSYRELGCKPELIVRGIKDEIFKPQRVIILTLEMSDCNIDGKELGGLLA